MLPLPEGESWGEGYLFNHPTNPFAKRKEIMRRRLKKPFVRLYVNHAVKDMEDAAQKTNRKYHKYLTKRMGVFIKKNLKEYEDPNIEKSNFYMPAGVPVILQPDSLYNEKFKFDGENVRDIDYLDYH